jgi:serine/threonine protein phosphatase PrpC
VSAVGKNWSAYSLQGKARERNSDAFATLDEADWQAFAVGDGVGSMPASPVASRAAVEAAIAASRVGQLMEAEDVPEAMVAIDRSVADALASDGEAGATTLAFVAIKGGRVLVLSVGDSEVHEISRSGPSFLLHPVDHVPAQPNILLAWLDGHTAYEAHVREIDPGDSLLCLMSDGVPGALSPEAIASVVRDNPVEDAARVLVLAAREAGATDDLTAVVVGPVRNE